jgi:hypothetical protein
MADAGASDVVLTTGGTGFTARDVTPEATRAVPSSGRRPASPRRCGWKARGTPYAWLSRGVAGIRGRTLIVNLPGSTGGVRDGLAVLERSSPTPSSSCAAPTPTCTRTMAERVSSPPRTWSRPSGSGTRSPPTKVPVELLTPSEDLHDVEDPASSS